MRTVRIVAALIMALIVAIAGIGAPTAFAQRAVVHCENFASQHEAQVAFVSANRADKELDPDGNGVACDDRDYVFRDDFLVPVTPTAAAEHSGAASTHTAIYAGDCAPGPFTNPVAPLNDPVLPTGDSVGTAPSPPVATSYSTIRVTLDTLTRSPHVLTVFDPHQPDRLLACGEIGGVVLPNGYLAIALNPGEGSTAFGIAHLSPVTETGRTGVSLFVTVPANAAATQVMAPAAS